MTERKEVIIQPPFSLKDGKRGQLDMVCHAHTVIVEYEWHGTTPYITLVLTENSCNLEQFSRRLEGIFDGPADKLGSLLHDLSTLDIL